jgi:hypothetical protein
MSDDPQEIEIEADIEVNHSGIGWALCGVVLLIAVLGEWYWIKRIDCALGVQPACAEIEKTYQPRQPAKPTTGE